MPNPGYSSPSAVKGLHSSGLKKVMVNNIAELLAVDTKVLGAVLAGNLGAKKRLELLKIALEKKIKVLNFKDLNKLKEKIETDFATRKKAKQEKFSEKNKKQEEKKKKAEEKKKKEEEEKKKAAVEKETGAEKGVEEKLKTIQEEQKEIVEKTITKRQ
jgi:outer membrane biosynthesis protein TonB